MYIISIHNTLQLLFNRVRCQQNLDLDKYNTILNNTNKVMNNNFYKLTYKVQFINSLMASITSGEMADCDWLSGTFSGHYFPVMTGGSIT